MKRPPQNVAVFSLPVLRTAVRSTLPFVASIVEPTGIAVSDASGLATLPGIWILTVPVAGSTTTDLPICGLGVSSPGAPELFEPFWPEPPGLPPPCDEGGFEEPLLGVLEDGVVDTAVAGTDVVSVVSVAVAGVVVVG